MTKRLDMNQIVSKLGAMMLIGVLITSVGTTQVFADWDKTVYPAIQGTIPIADGEDYTTKNKISLVDAMAIAENIAAWIFEKLKDKVPVSSIKFFEGTNKYCEITKD